MKIRVQNRNPEFSYAHTKEKMECIQNEENTNVVLNFIEAKFMA